jgi:hypothetical protein
MKTGKKKKKTVKDRFSELLHVVSESTNFNSRSPSFFNVLCYHILQLQRSKKTYISLQAP